MLLASFSKEKKNTLFTSCDSIMRRLGILIAEHQFSVIIIVVGT
jgi:hypothetical protein